MIDRETQNGWRGLAVGAMALRRALYAATAVGAVMALTPIAQAQTQTYDIAAQPLGQALAAFTRTSGLKVVYNAALPKVTSPGAKGDLTASEALSKLLAGSGLSYRVSGSTVTLEAAPQAEGATALGTIRVEGASGGAGGGVAPLVGETQGDPSENQYRTAGSGTHVTEETIKRIMPTSTGDLLKSTPGVLSAGNRNGASLNVNIRGLQGQNRVATMIDGALQQSSTYRGYTGHDARLYVDPEFIAGVDVTRGPGEAAGAMGGSIDMRTLNARDVVADGETWGVRLRGGLNGNMLAKPPLSTTTRRKGDGEALSSQNHFASLVGGWVGTDYDVVAGYARRKHGNYVTGKHGTNKPPIEPYALSPYLPGEEVFSTSEDTTSILLKGRYYRGDHGFELGGNYYNSKYGEAYVDLLGFGMLNEGTLSEVTAKTYTARYQYAPENPLIFLKANLWRTEVDNVLGAMSLVTDAVTTGFDVSNRSRFTVGDGDLSLTYGVQHHKEDIGSDYVYPTSPTASGPEMNGTRSLSQAFVRTVYRPTERLTLNGQISLEHFKMQDGAKTPMPDHSGSKWLHNVGATYEVADGYQLFATYATGWRPPSVREAYLNMSSLLTPNPEIRPEYSFTYELGSNISHDGVWRDNDRLRLKLAWFDGRYTDMLGRGTPAGKVRGFHNLIDMSVEGLEISGSYDAGVVFTEFGINRYTKVDYCFEICGSFTQSDDYGQLHIPPKYSGSVTAGVRLLDEKLTLGVRMTYAGIRAVPRRAFGVNGAITSPWDRYKVFDVFGSYALNDRLKVDLTIENAEDDYYLDALEYLVPSPGRIVRLNLTSSFGGPNLYDGKRPKAVRAPVRHLTEGSPLLGAFDGDWTGLYIGGHVGRTSLKTEGRTVNGNGQPGVVAATESTNERFDAFGRGIQAGYNYQFAGNWVAGVEVDGSWSELGDIKGVVSQQTPALISGGWKQATIEHHFGWAASVRGRMGYALDRALVYATAGVTATEETQVRTQFREYYRNSNTTGPIFTETAKVVRTGWVLGGGVEYALDNRWSVKGEYLVADYGDESFYFPKGRAGISMTYTTTTVLRDPVTNAILRDPVTNAVLTRVDTFTGSSDVVEGRIAKNDAKAQTLRIGLNYRF